MTFTHIMLLWNETVGNETPTYIEYIYVYIYIYTHNNRYITILLYVTRTGKNSNGKKEKFFFWKFIKLLAYVTRYGITITIYNYHQDRFSGWGVHKSRQTDKHSFLCIRLKGSTIDKYTYIKPKTTEKKTIFKNNKWKHNGIG